MMSEAKYKILIVEDEHLFRDLLVKSLSHLSHIEVIGSYPNGESTLELAAHDPRPDVALLDISLGEGYNGIETGLYLRKKYPQIGLIWLSHHVLPDLLSTIPEEEIPGTAYILKHSCRDIATLERAIDGVAHRLVVIDPSLIQAMVQQRQSPISRLSARQLDILRLMAEGYNNNAIAQALFLSEKSIESQLTSLYAALNIHSTNSSEHSRVKAVLTYLQQGQGYLKADNQP